MDDKGVFENSEVTLKMHREKSILLTAFQGTSSEMLLRLLFEQNGIPAKLSHNAGTSFCNKLYWNGLKSIEDNYLNTKMVFGHVPFVKKIEDFELFRQRIYNTLKVLEGGNI